MHGVTLHVEKKGEKLIVHQTEWVRPANRRSWQCFLYTDALDEHDPLKRYFECIELSYAEYDNKNQRRRAIQDAVASLQTRVDSWTA